MVDPGRDLTALEDFPLHAGGTPELRLESAAAPAPLATRAAAPLWARSTAAAADAAAVLLITALAILAARLVTGSSPGLPGIPWAVGFLVYLSFFATIPPLVLFGRTVGMAIADLSARPSATDGGMAAPAALRRWIGTLATAVSAGLPLLWTARNTAAPTPADRLSGHPLTLD